MKVPRAVQNLIDSFEKLPGIGPKSAQRLTFYLLHVPQDHLDSFSSALSNLKKNTVLCSVCKNVAEHDPCSICSDPGRDQRSIMVVEQSLDVLALERTGRFRGVYHVLHGSINPLENIGPDEIFIRQLVSRVKEHSGTVEVILATNPTMEGEATAMFIKKQIEQLPANGVFIAASQKSEDNTENDAKQICNSASQSEAGHGPHGASRGNSIKVTRLGLGLPTGADLEYADETTLTQAIEGRRNF